jgi:hypothetical protein
VSDVPGSINTLETACGHTLLVGYFGSRGDRETGLSLFLTRIRR